MRVGKRVPLRSTRDADGSRHLFVHLNETGDVIVEGQDLGHGVERAFGAGRTENEWRHTVRAADVPRLVEALGGTPGRRGHRAAGTRLLRRRRGAVGDASGARRSGAGRALEPGRH